MHGGPSSAAFNETHESFVGFHDLAARTHRGNASDAHCLTETMGNEPRSLEGAAKGTRRLKEPVAHMR
jgi:hypothetical protein